jgi:adenylate cyclase
MTPEPPDAKELVELGLLDPAAADAEERLELLAYAFELGASVADVRAAKNLGELVLDLKLRPRETATLREVMDEIGIDEAIAQRFLAASGLPTDTDRQVTLDEEAMLRLFANVSELLGDQATVQVARVAGNAMARLAETIVTAFRLQLELPQQAGGARYVDVVKQYAELADLVLPEFVRSLDVMLRRQIVAVAERVWSTDEEQTSVTLARTVGFADLVGYTAAATAMSVRELADVLVAFDERTSDIIQRHRGQVVKTIGDEVLFAVESPANACRIALELVDAFGNGLPEIRVGLATGEVVSMFGDVYGPVVNLASRLVSLAQPGSVVTSDAVREAAGDEFAFGPRRDVEVKGLVDPIPVFDLGPR